METPIIGGSAVSMDDPTTSDGQIDMMAERSSWAIQSEGRIKAIESMAHRTAESLAKKLLLELLRHCRALETAMRRGATLRIGDAYVRGHDVVFYVTDSGETLSLPACSINGSQLKHWYAFESNARKAKTPPDHVCTLKDIEPWERNGKK